jgi:hypothetical protein
MIKSEDDEKKEAKTRPKRKEKNIFTYMESTSNFKI